MPITNEKNAPVAKLRFQKAERSTIGCLAVNARQKKRTQPATAAIAE